jgi:2-polyprenyl-3-methyl-5-hydroxy-6-metoxy-1,4-benzoquinol methylase
VWQKLEEKNMNGLSNYDSAEVEKHFDEFGIKEWERLVETPVDEVSLYIHTHYLKKYVQANSYVLEIGAGAGRFTKVLAYLNAKVVVADISRVQLDLNQYHAQKYNFSSAIAAWQQVDICEMKEFKDRKFDCVVAYGGPISYVLDKRDSALKECIRVLKPGGILLLSVMSLWGSAHRHLKGVLGIPTEINQKVTATGNISPETFPGRGNYMHMFRADELKKWLQKNELEIVQISASNGLSIGWDDWLRDNKGDENKWKELLRMELEACAEESSHNMGTHIIAIVQKKISCHKTSASTVTAARQLG